MTQNQDISHIFPLSFFFNNYDNYYSYKSVIFTTVKII